MATFSLTELVLDLLAGVVDSLLTAHTPDFGPAWSAVNTYTLKLDGAGYLYQPANVATKTVGAVRPGAVPTANQWAQCTVHRYSNVGFDDDHSGVAIRWTTGGGTDTFYALYYSTSSQNWKLVKVIADVETVLATYSGLAPIGGEASAGLHVSGTTLTAEINGVQQTPVTNADIAGPGQIGLIQSSVNARTAGTGVHVGRILAGYVA